ncbi:hypothetical protein V2G26_007962 [Clonostachys chloroleuca]
MEWRLYKAVGRYKHHRGLSRHRFSGRAGSDQWIASFTRNAKTKPVARLRQPAKYMEEPGKWAHDSPGQARQSITQYPLVVA